MKILIILLAMTCGASAMTSTEKAAVARIEALATAQAGELAQAKAESSKLKTSLGKAKTEIADLKTQADSLAAFAAEQQTAAVAALEKATYWQEKQAKALKELWIYRSILIFAGTVILALVAHKLARIFGVV
jgi:NTP pyrophosphatase (non-canonical NTP hydrolase)